MQRDGRGVGRSSATSTSESAARTEAQPGRSTLTAQLEPAPARTSSPPLFEHGGEWEKIPTGEYALEGDGDGMVARAGGASAASQDQLDTVATAAIDRKGAGRAIDSAVRGPVEAQLGTDLGHARVHDDANAQHAARAMGARAFAHGGDVFLGAGESERDPALMAHELTHVAQQTGSGRAQPLSTLARTDLRGSNQGRARTRDLESTRPLPPKPELGALWFDTCELATMVLLPPYVDPEDRELLAPEEIARFADEGTWFSYASSPIPVRRVSRCRSDRANTLRPRGHTIR